MRYLVLTLPLLLLSMGCGDFKKALEGPAREPATPPGVAPVEGIDADSPGTDQAADQAGSSSGDEQRDESIIGKTTNEVVDMRKAMAENPNLEIAEGDVSGSDPLSVAGSAYTVAASKTSTLGMQQAVRNHKALHGEYPSYERFMEIMNENGVTFAKMRPYRVYGYDSETGKVVVLVDTALKKKIYAEKGIPLEE